MSARWVARIWKGTAITLEYYPVLSDLTEYLRPQNAKLPVPFEVWCGGGEEPVEPIIFQLLGIAVMLTHMPTFATVINREYLVC